jgi:hypothetical protein
MFVDMIPVLIVPVAIVEVIHVVPMLHGLVAIAFVVHPIVIGVDFFLLMPLAIVEVINMAIVFAGGMTVSGQVLVIDGLVVLGHGISLSRIADTATVLY